MNKIKLLSELQDFFDSDEAKKRKNLEDIEDVLIKLKSKLVKTKRLLSQCKNEVFNKALQLEVDVLTAQLEKGKKILKQVSQNSNHKND
jgi:hypothetical protein